MSTHFESESSEEEQLACSVCKKEPCDCEEDKEKERNENYEKKRKQKTKEDIEREALEMGDLYGLLGLGDKKHESTDSEIARAYKKMALRYHPDKLGDKITQQDKDHWLKLQNAYETLSDPLKKKKYDSSLPFDDSLPNEEEINESNFFE